MVNFYAVFFSLFISFGSLNAQSFLKDSTLNAVLINANYSLQFPMGDLDDRFGLSSNLGMGISFKVKKNFLIGAEGNFVFGEKIKEDILFKNIITRSGQLLSFNGGFGDISLSMRGYMLKGYLGKIIAFKKPNANSGITITVGVGVLQHKVKINVDDNLPQLNDNYKKGYDRLTNGVSLSQFIGYTYLDPKKRINFYIGIEFNEAFTQSRRSWNFDLDKKDDSARNDIILGIKAGWILPVYFTSTEKYYYY